MLVPYRYRDNLGTLVWTGPSKKRENWENLNAKPFLDPDPGGNNEAMARTAEEAVSFIASSATLWLLRHRRPVMFAAFAAFFAEGRRCLRPLTSSSPSSPNAADEATCIDVPLGMPWHTAWYVVPCHTEQSSVHWYGTKFQSLVETAGFELFFCILAHYGVNLSTLQTKPQPQTGLGGACVLDLSMRELCRHAKETHRCIPSTEKGRP
ncbi:hypothetical protein BHE74_00031692 [Ensete ventricosum]|nr:hypothetical protein GW17_00024903 [Ensete ventricosum]RWW61258.1 hypothetical protein BHE74_00031692 [Ensete ventricosum]